MTNEDAIELLEHTVVIDIDDTRKEKKYEAIKMGVNALKAQKVGKWKTKDFHTVFCSGCEFEVDIMVTPDNLLNHLNHCPNCGIKMEVRNNEW